MIALSREMVRAAAYGGALLGGGGGGSIEEGMCLGNLAVAVGRPRLVDLDELDDDALIVAVSAVGAPAAADQYIEPIHYVQALLLLLEHLDAPVAGLITSENGGLSSLNGWFQSAVTGIPVADAPCNGRAHPTGLMGSMGLDREMDYLSRQAAVGGNPDRNRHVCLYVESGLDSASQLVRQAAVRAGGVVAVARNPVTVAYVRENAAPGTLRQAIQVGKTLLEAENPVDAARSVCDLLSGELICRAMVENVALRTKDGFDIGLVELSGGYELTFWNEYMTLEHRGKRLATFPDLIATLSADEIRPLTSAEIRAGQEVLLIQAPKEQLRLGAGMRRPELLRIAEEAVGKEMVRYVFG
ncbi:MAG TPA: DUF917 family protein [Anaerolineales bacterium]|nr:DUF917 family protein [Anaerolineales bacterium]HIP95620.1 DUF917 family protein [Anaerolineae bacterium]